MTRRGSYGSRRDRRGPMPLVLLSLLALAGAVLLVRGAFRVGPEATITILPATKAIGARTPVEVTVEEPSRGLSEITIELVQGAKTHRISQTSHRPREAWAFWGPKTEREALRVEVGRDVQKGLVQAPATIRVTAGRAASWLRHPGPVVRELTLPVRLTPPSLSILSSFTYVNQGGCETVVYRVGETAVKDGVRAGERFFPGFPLPGGGPQDRFALFAVPYDLGDVARVTLIAQDDVGNEAHARFVDKFFARPLRRDTIPLDDAFLEKVVGPILSQTPDLADKGNLLENYLQINRDLRAANNARLVELATTSQPRFLWTKTFQPMGSTKVMASFADRRSYVYRGRAVDQQDHLGLDMAGVARSPVPAANDGVVVLAEFFGIYGNAVVIDHGYGLMSLYGHLSSIDVKEGQTVHRGQAVGRSGDTGLAAGDHLHFAVLLQGLPVSPVEWWDGHWLQDRIERKLGAAFPFAG